MNKVETKIKQLNNNPQPSDQLETKIKSTIPFTVTPKKINI